MPFQIVRNDITKMRTDIVVNAANTIFVIITDGMENASHIYSAEKVKRMIEHEKEKYGW